jgi:GNAT superfamily N-acetyltransferase
VANILAPINIPSPSTFWPAIMGLTYFKRFRMEIDLRGRDFSRPRLPHGFYFMPWELGQLEAHADTKYQSFRSEIDSNVFPCLGDYAGCLRLMEEIASKPGFLPEATWLVACRENEVQNGSHFDGRIDLDRFHELQTTPVADSNLRSSDNLSQRQGISSRQDFPREQELPHRQAALEVLHAHHGKMATRYCGTVQGVYDRSGMGAIQNLGVVPDFRGLGLGTALMEQALAGFQKAGLKRAFLEVTAQNSSAVRLYKQLGFSRSRTVYKVCEVAYA